MVHKVAARRATLTHSSHQSKLTTDSASILDVSARISINTTEKFLQRERDASPLQYNEDPLVVHAGERRKRSR